MNAAQPTPAPVPAIQTTSGDGAFRLDGWANLLTGLGMAGHDKKKHVTYRGDEVQDADTLANLYRTDGFAQKVVDRPVFDMLREGFRVEVTEPGEADGETQTAEAGGVLTYLDALAWKSKVGEFLRWDRLYGGALLIVGANDGRTLESPIGPDVRTIEFLRILDINAYDREQGLVKDPASPRYLEPEYYVVNPGAPTEYKVHHTRALELRGVKVPPNVRGSYKPARGAGDSVLQANFAALRGLGVVYSDTESILDDFVTTVLTVKGLQGMIAAGKERQVLERLKLMDLARAIINTQLLDENEQFSKVTSSVAGLAELIDRFAERLSAVSGIPYRILMGKQEGGLNNKGEGETRDYYDHIDAMRDERLSPVAEWLTELVFRASDGPTNGKVPADWSITFPPLWQQSDEEKSKVYLSMAQGDSLYIDRGVLSAAEVASSRFGGDGYSLDTTLQTERTLPTEE